MSQEDVGPWGSGHIWVPGLPALGHRVGGRVWGPSLWGLCFQRAAGWGAEAAHPPGVSLRPEQGLVSGLLLPTF